MVNPRLWTVITPQYKMALDDLVKAGAYLSLGDAVRSALRLLFQHHGLKIPYGEIDRRIPNREIESR